jgi:hypothetical protein
MYCCKMSIFTLFIFKGIVQRKPRWVKIGISQQVPYCSSVGVLDILDLAKNVLSLFEPKFLVMCERIGEARKMVFSVYQFVKTWY